MLCTLLRHTRHFTVFIHYMVIAAIILYKIQIHTYANILLHILTYVHSCLVAALSSEWLFHIHILICFVLMVKFNSQRINLVSLSNTDNKYS